MSHDATVWAWRQDVDNSGDLIVLLALADMANETNDFEVWASHAYIGRKAKRSPRSVRSSIVSLEAKGLVTTRSNFGGPDIIALAIPDEFVVRRERDDGRAKTARTAATTTAAKTATAAKPEANRGNGCLLTLEGNQRSDELGSAGREDARPLVDRCADVYRDITTRQVGWGKLQLLNDARRKALPLRVKEAGGFEAWRDIMLSAETSAFLTGKTAQGFTATFDFFLQPSSFAKLAEGFYHRERQSHGSQPTDPRGDARRASADQRTSNMLTGFALAAERAKRGGGPA